MKPLAAQSRAVALLLVLAFMAIITFLVLAFFSSVSTERTAAKSYADEVSAHQLVDSAVGVVMNQIREATSVPQGAWASQPGMLRVFRDGDLPGPTAFAFYKLYSSDHLTVRAGEIAKFDPTGDAPLGPKGWRAQPALFTDLNEPTNVAATQSEPARRRYPIFDPTIAGVSGSPTTEKIEGYSIAKLPAGETGAPMPVRWIYQLRNGTLTAPDTTSGTVAKWTNAANPPTKANPIVGRIAFWTDDDTCKVNVNTAGGFLLPDATKEAEERKVAGSFWDTPRVLTNFERGSQTPDGLLKTGGLANAQPAQNEFQRYPGHPSTTSLGLVFGNLLGKNYGLDSEKLYAWLPRLQPGGSLGGTARLNAVEDTPLELKTERLFATVDEMFYAPKRAGADRVNYDQKLGLPAGSISPTMLDRARPFLTAHSRAPELTLFGRPRITMWPVHTNAKFHNSTDRLLLFCSQVGGKEFIFRREDPYSPTNDFGLARNQALFKFLREQTAKTTGRIPGFGLSFEDKYGDAPGGRDEILTQVFDYIRSVNLKDTTRDKFIPLAEREQYRYGPRGLVVPTRATVDGKKVSGLGRFPTITEASLVFYHAGYIAAKSKPFDPDMIYYDPAESAQLGVEARLLRAFLVFETFNPMQGYAPMTNLTGADSKLNRVFEHQLEITGDLSIQTTSGAAKKLDFGTKRTNRFTTSSGGTWGGRNFGGTEGFMHPMVGRTSDVPGNATFYPFQTTGPGIRIPAGTGTFAFSGGKTKLTIRFGSTDVQTVTLDFPPSSAPWPLPTPEVWRDLGGFDPTVPGFDTVGTRQGACSLARRLAWAQQHSYNPWSAVNGGDDKHYADRWRQILQPGDTIRSLVLGRQPSESDVRVAFLEQDVTQFRPHPDYATHLPRAQTLRRGDGAFYFAGGSTGSLIALPTGKQYGGGRGPDIPKGITALRADDGAADFDTGIGNYPDGCYGGKADEGNVVWRYFDKNADRWVFVEPYFSTAAYDPPLDTYFSPNRQVPSAVMFGSLLSRRSGWETLLFCPNPAGPAHNGQRSPPDHLLLDLFTMPVVEPYAISEPYSTAGKVNLNYQLAPFSYITRSTALRAALHSLRVTAIPQAAVDTYKSKQLDVNYRLLVDRDQTIAAFDDFFKDYKRVSHSRGFFKSATEICDRFLYPKGTTNAGEVTFEPGEKSIRNFWAQNALTGDNVREKPYADLYPRVTTKSNTYTVHTRAQVLRPRPDAAPTEWDEARASILAEERRATTIERYIDPQDPRLRNEINVDTDSLETAYRFRVIHTERFSPW